MSGSIAWNTLSSIYNNSFMQYLKSSETIGGTIFEQSLSVDSVFKSTLELVKCFGQYRKPLNPLAEHYLTEALFREIDRVIAFETKASDNVFGITLISKSVKIFEWVKELETEKFIAKLHKYIQFYNQKAQCEIESLGRTHFEWLQYWNETYEEFSIFVINFFKDGIVWTGNESLPVSHVLGDSSITQKTGEHKALLNDLNKGANIQNILHHRTSEETSKVFKKLEDKWLIQNQKDSHKDLLLNTARKEEDICIYNCQDCTIVIQNVVHTIRLDICTRVTILFRNAFGLEAADCRDCNFHCFENVDGVELTSCCNCGIYLSDKALKHPIVTARCSGISLNFPFEDGLYQSFIISDQLKTKIVPNKGIETVVEQQ